MQVLLKVIRIGLFSALGAFLIVLGVILFSNWRINTHAAPFVFDNLENLPHNKVGLILGTSKKLKNGQENRYFRYRIDAAVALYKSGKIDYILVSGDNSEIYYNEPRDMRKALLAQGIPEEVIFLDYAGFRTLDSVIRAKEIFGQRSFTIISQEFHNKRAIFIANKHNINAIGYNARDLDTYSGLKTQLRERLARVLVFIDLYVLNTQPKFLGEKIEID